MTLTKNDCTLFHVFTGENAKGNPATVQWVDQLPDSNYTPHGHLNSTAVYIKPIVNHVANRYEFQIRWFNNTKSIQRCGHGTLAAAAFLKQHYTYDKFIFHSKKERLTVGVNNNYYSLELPIESLSNISNQALLCKCLRVAKTKALDGYLITELDTEEDVRAFQLTPALIETIDQRALIVTAKSQSPQFDIVFRYFAPQHGSPEDMATGSAASTLWPFWTHLIENQIENHAEKNTLHCYQASADGGIIKITGTKNCINVIGAVTKT